MRQTFPCKVLLVTWSAPRLLLFSSCPNGLFLLFDVLSVLDPFLLGVVHFGESLPTTGHPDFAHNPSPTRTHPNCGGFLLAATKRLQIKKQKLLGLSPSPHGMPKPSMTGRFFSEWRNDGVQVPVVVLGLVLEGFVLFIRGCWMILECVVVFLSLWCFLLWFRSRF